MSQMKKQQNEEVKNVIIAMILVTIIMFTFNQFSTPKQTSETLQNEPVKISQVEQTNLNNVIPQSEVVVEKKADPVLLKNEFVEASFDPALGGFNKVALLKYKETLEADSKNISVLDNDYFTSLLWKSRDAQMPSKTSFWKEDETRSTSQKKVFVFQNEDVKIEREVTLDNQYMVVIKDTITNLMQMPIKTYQEGFISRKMESNPPVSTVHQGFVGYLNDYLVEEKYDTDEKIYSDRTKDGWFGFTDKYWQTLMVLNPNENVSVSFVSDQKETYKAFFETDNFLIQPNESVTKTSRLFVGAKDIDVINAYQKDLKIPHFDLSIDFGWFRFLTQPFLHFLNWLYALLGNMGVAILVFATLIRFALLPIATKSYESMAKMRKVQPKIKDLQTKFKKDPRRLQIEMANLYKREKINPASGCLPLLLQIPVFFALYKVLSISINMRQAPFFGWIQDLSMPDPLSPFNGFGYFDIALPAFLTIGIWPILMGLTMYIQQKLSPAPADKTQAKVMLLLPVIFTLMMGSFASGLIIYWTWSNILSIFQQKYIMKKVGVE
ncbi:MAG: membrane protein insertase YidC [Alphaproteobacteria bacterium]|nr:membrane protein insertase YidC [Alphaproteobacteria bacterium]